MMQPSTPKLALITGAAKRIGREIALSLASQGWSVAIHYHHSSAEAECLKEELTKYGTQVMTLQADLTDEAQVSAIIPQVNSQLGTITCLINNASGFINDTLATTTRSIWDTHMETNLRAPILLMQQFAQQLPPEHSGNIINMLDYVVRKLPESFFSYAISKSGLWAATQMLAMELAPWIRVNGIGPGHVMPSPRQSEASFVKLSQRSPLQHSSSPEEICRTIAFILSSPSITGQMIALDSGMHLSNQPYS